MNYSQKYNLVAFLEPIEVEARFKMTDWPLHITIADVFAVKLQIGIQQKLTNLLSEQPSLIDMYPEGDWQQRKVLANFKLVQA